jgi:DNA-binding protein HU-beta
MTRDWKSEAAVVMDALLAQGRARWPTVGRFRVDNRPSRTTDEQGRPQIRRLVRFTPDPGFIDSLEQELVTVEGFGMFAVKHYAAYEGRNPHTGERLRVEATRGVLFRSADELRDRVAGMTLPAADDELDD